MVAVIHWYAVGVFATIMTLAWLFVDVRVTFTTLFAGAGWGYMALTGSNVEKVLQDGSTTSIGDPSLQLFVGALAALSILASVLYRFGLYPPESIPERDGEGDDPAHGNTL